MADLDIQRIKRRIAEFAESGRLDASVITELSVDGGFAPIECEVLDYKETLATDRLSLCSVVLDIVALHNSFGGYLIFGVRESEPDVHFEAVGVDPSLLRLEQLRDLVDRYTGSRIALTLRFFDIPCPSGPARQVGVLHVSKRQADAPVHFVKDGPAKAGGKLLFSAEDTVFRRGDETLRATGKYFPFLFGPRRNPFEELIENPLSSAASRPLLEHNLPDRAFICPTFVGRKAELELLWEWLTDDFSHVRVLAGEGGLGKTSIAYQFAQEVCGEPTLGLSQVVWLTAKQKQFSGMQNKFVDVPETHFTTYVDLLREMCRKLAATEAELSGASEKGLKRLIQEGTHTLPTLFVIDDVDSLPQEEQRKALELGFLFNGTKARLLATTRINQSYSTDIAVQVSGFSFEEYAAFVETLRERFLLPQLTEHDIRKMHEVTSGNPMYTESIYRLVRFSKPSEAFRQWRTGQGEMARAAALGREIEQLTPEARRVLLAAAYLRESSLSELAHVTGYGSQSVNERLAELRALHLLSAPQITEEVRVRISSTTEDFVKSRADALATDHNKLYQRALHLRKEAKQVKAVRNSRLVGAAIDQAIAQLKRKDFEGAVETITVALRGNPNHPDLQCMLARCLLKFAPPRFDEARRLARSAYNGGSRKDILFDVWYRAEELAHHSVGAAEVATLALECGVSPKESWMERRAAASWEIAKAQAASGNIDRAIDEYWACDAYVVELLRHAHQAEVSVLRGTSERLHDEIWKLSIDISGNKILAATAGLDVLRRAIEAGDSRVAVYLRIAEAMGWIADEFGKDSWPLSKAQLNLAETRLREARALIETRCVMTGAGAASGAQAILRAFEMKERQLLEVIEMRGSG